MDGQYRPQRLRQWPVRDRKPRALPARGRCVARRHIGPPRRGPCARLRAWASEQADRISRLLPLVHRLVSGRQFSEKRPKARRRAWRMAVFVAEVEVEADPFVVVRPSDRGHPSPFQPPFKGYRCFCGHLLHRNVHGSIPPGHGPMSGILVQLPGPQQAKKVQTSLYKD